MTRYSVIAPGNYRLRRGAKITAASRGARAAAPAAHSPGGAPTKAAGGTTGGIRLPSFLSAQYLRRPFRTQQTCSKMLRQKYNLSIPAAWCHPTRGAGTISSWLKTPLFQLNTMFGAGDVTTHATPSSYLHSQHPRALLSPVHTSKLPPGRGRDKQKSIFPCCKPRKTCASKMDARKPWGLGMPTGRNKT